MENECTFKLLTWFTGMKQNICASLSQPISLSLHL